MPGAHGLSEDGLNALWLLLKKSLQPNNIMKGFSKQVENKCA